ncbi:MAG: hypothetical protein GDA52_11670 [Rhodobacteraceae bacterium]|nr:hypothetical protein [Paracoccaceae bacterium]
MPPIKIRGQNKARKHEPYPLSEFSESVIQVLGKHIVHYLAVGHTDVSGDDFASMFAQAIGGMHYAAPLGIADVAWNGIGWSVKTVKNRAPHSCTSVRLISGRNAPSYSAGISNPFNDIQATGRAVIEIYNARIDQAKDEHDELRMLVFIRDMPTRRFTIYEREISKYPVNNFEWRLNRNKNFEAWEGARHAFTWQPHGSQFTILEPVPSGASRFQITKNVPVLEMQQIINLVRFSPDWIRILD